MCLIRTANIEGTRPRSTYVKFLNPLPLLPALGSTAKLPHAFFHKVH